MDVLKKLSISEIARFMNDDETSDKKKFARIGQKYYEGDHDIRHYRIFYYDANGDLQEDTARANVKIPHPFLTELVDQCTQLILSGDERIVRADDPALQTEMDDYFNYNEDFTAELSELLTGCQAKGFEYMYAYKTKDDKTAFMCADSIGVIEVRARDTDANTDYVIYWYVNRIEKGKKVIKRIQVWDKENVTFYVKASNGQIAIDNSQKINPLPHTTYTKDGDKATYFETYGFIPFFRLDHNKKQFSLLKTVKPLIDDYDLMASSLSNNLIDFDTPLHVVKGYEGDNMDELQTNLKTKKIIGTGENGDVDIKTVDVPYQARKEKMELDEKNIYRFGMGLNTAGLKDTSATTNIAIKAAYSLLELQCNKLEIRLKKLLRHLVRIVIEEINKTEQKGYQDSDVYFKFEHVIMSNAQENAQIKLTEAQAHQVVINTIMSLADTLDDETIIKAICDELDIDYEEIKDKLPKDAEKDTVDAKQLLDGVVTNEQATEGSSASTTE